MDIPTFLIEHSPAGYVGQNGEPLTQLQGSRVNMFVGATNSGKSRLVRSLFSDWTGKCLFDSPKLKKTVEKIDNCRISLHQLLASNASPHPELSQPFNGFSLRTDSNSPLRSLVNKIAREKNTNRNVTDLCTKLSGLLDQLPPLTERQFVYIPLLRGLRPFADSRDVYRERTQTDYGFDSKLNIFTGLQMFDTVREMLLGNQNERSKIASYQQFLSTTLFEGRPLLLVPREKHDNGRTNDVLYVIIGNEPERPIYELGDGVQAAIALTFMTFIVPSGAFFIEEPEINLHPGLQRKILAYYTSCQNHTFFMTTHSNHLLELTADFSRISVSTIRKVPHNDELRFEVNNVSRGDRSALELLGVRAASVLLVNATIWVEGISERWFFREILKLRTQHLRDPASAAEYHEDVHYSFLEYGGSNITHWSFLDNEKMPISVDTLCSRLILIMDNDNGKNPERKKKLRDHLGDRLLILPTREVENLLPPKVLSETVARLVGNKIPEIDIGSWEGVWI